MPSTDRLDLHRRRFCLVGGAAAIGLLAGCRRSTPVADAQTIEASSADVSIVEFSNSGERTGEQTVPKIVKTEAEWRKQLSLISFEVTRHADTERPGTSPLLDEHGTGVFRCICCDTALFNSATKFDSGTGWPSFWQPIAKENVVELMDSSLFMVRTAVSCRRCDAHLGHVFDDGPQPTGLRYCMNGAALTFAGA